MTGDKVKDLTRNVFLWLFISVFFILKYYYNVEHPALYLMPFLLMVLAILPFMGKLYEGAEKRANQNFKSLKRRNLTEVQLDARKNRLQKVLNVIESGHGRYIQIYALRNAFCFSALSITINSIEGAFITFILTYIISKGIGPFYWEDVFNKKKRLEFELEQGCKTKILYTTFSIPPSAYIIAIFGMVVFLQSKIHQIIALY